MILSLLLEIQNTHMDRIYGFSLVRGPPSDRFRSSVPCHTIADFPDRFRSVNDGSAPCQTFEDFVQAAGRLYVTSVETPVNSYSLMPFQLEVSRGRGAARQQGRSAGYHKRSCCGLLWNVESFALLFLFIS